ncbi:hypothetical protein ACFQ0B_68210 [Nonomuraea thailandensis]
MVTVVPVAESVLVNCLHRVCLCQVRVGGWAAAAGEAVIATATTAPIAAPSVRNLSMIASISQ